MPGFAIQNKFDAYFSHKYLLLSCCVRKMWKNLCLLDMAWCFIAQPRSCGNQVTQLGCISLTCEGTPVEGMWIRSGKSDSVEQEINYGLQ